MATLNGKVINIKRVGADAGRVVGNSLKSLRELAKLTQAQMAARMNIGQAAISKIETRGDVQISTLQRYVEALGAQLRIDATFEASAIEGSSINEVFDADISDDDQLVFPIFGDELFRPQRDVVLSIRPQYSNKIISGEKTVELRRRFPISAPRGTIAYIYSTSPVRALIGCAEISDVVKLPISEIWEKYSDSAGIAKNEFYSYFSGLDKGYVLKFKNARQLPRQLNLAELRERFDFEPPQSFLYVTPRLRSALENEYSSISN
jgi:predicted transcriptional regulator/DNA-binding XRE family transcriptional regulator